MKAWVLYGIGDIRYEERKMPELKAGEVLVKVKAAGVCGSDVPRVYQTGAHRHPLILGHEFSGIVEAVGTTAATKWIGKRVGIFPLLPCGKCAPCLNKHYEMCRNYSYLGSRQDGGFAEFVAVPEKNLLPLPDAVGYEEAAMLEPMAVAVHAMRQVKLTGSQTVVVCGMGTIGMLLCMFLREAGVEKLLVIGNKEFQRQTAENNGIKPENFCDAGCGNVQQWVLAHTDGNGADVFFECVGKNETFSQAVEMTAPAGQVVLVGNPYSDMELEKEIYWKILRNQLTIKGTWNSSFTGETGDDWHYVLERLEHGKIVPTRLISHRLAMDKLESGMQIMRDKSEDYMKIMCVVEH